MTSFALLGLLDIGFLGVVGSSIAPPLAISIVVALVVLRRRPRPQRV